uniref:Uncharacterized protein n=1 Tax=Romanomermis culicivorax TaxID=13658 RepID=A0A915IG72_ROMCU
MWTRNILCVIKNQSINRFKSTQLTAAKLNAVVAENPLPKDINLTDENSPIADAIQLADKVIDHGNNRSSTGRHYDRRNMFYIDRVSDRFRYRQKKIDSTVHVPEPIRKGLSFGDFYRNFLICVRNSLQLQCHEWNY